MPGNNPYYAGADGLSAFATTTIALARTSGDPFSLLSIDLARDNAFDSSPSVTFTGTLAGGGTVVEKFTVSTPSPPLVFQPFDFEEFTNATSVSWGELLPGSSGVHQFSNIHLSTAAAVPKTPALTSLALGIPLVLAYASRRRRQDERRIIGGIDRVAW